MMDYAKLLETMHAASAAIEVYLTQSQCPVTATDIPKWNDTKNPPEVDTLVWAIWKNTNHVYMHIYKGKDDLDWENFTEWTQAPAHPKKLIIH